MLAQPSAFGGDPISAPCRHRTRQRGCFRQVGRAPPRASNKAKKAGSLGAIAGRRVLRWSGGEWQWGQDLPDPLFLRGADRDLFTWVELGNRKAPPGVGGPLGRGLLGAETMGSFEADALRPDRAHRSPRPRRRDASCSAVGSCGHLCLSENTCKDGAGAGFQMNVARTAHRLQCFGYLSVFSLALAFSPPLKAAQEEPSYIRAHQRWQACVTRAFMDLGSSGFIPAIRVENAFLACSTEEHLMSTGFRLFMGEQRGSLALVQSRAAMKTHLLSQQQRSDEQQHKKQQQEVFYVGRFFSCSLGIIKMDKIAPPENKHANLTINQTSILLSSEALGILRRLPVIRVHPGKAVELENDAILLLDDEGKFNFILPMGGKTLLDSKSHLIGTCS